MLKATNLPIYYLRQISQEHQLTQMALADLSIRYLRGENLRQEGKRIETKVAENRGGVT